MIKHRWFFILLAVALIAVAGTGVWAQSLGSFDLSWHTINNGGGHASSASYRLDGVLGQADSGSLTSASYQLAGGFMQCFTRASVNDASISDLGGGDAQLSWTGTGTYDVWKSSDPYFQPGDASSSLDGDEVTSPYTAAGVIGDPQTNVYFLIIAQNECGESLPSNRTGEFDFALTPGSP